MNGMKLDPSLANSALVQPSKSKAESHAQLLTQAEKWVGQTFFGTMLKQMRNSPFKSDLFGGGKSGQTFSELYDQQLADRMSRGVGAKLVRAIVRQVEANKAYTEQDRRNPKADKSSDPVARIPSKLAA